MQLPSSYLPEKIRSAVRFTIVGTTGSVVQTWFFMAALYLMGEPESDTGLFYAAFCIGFVCEMIPNYLFSNWYTFGTKPSLKNAGGFVLARAINLVLQLALLPLVLDLFPNWREDVISLIVIFIAGCINYLVCLFFFKKKNNDSTN